MIRGKLCRIIRHQRALVRSYFMCVFQHVLEGIALDVVFNVRTGTQQFRQIKHIVRAYMALIRPRMHGKPLRASIQHDASRAHHTGYAQRARVTQQSDFIEIYTQACHGYLQTLQINQQLPAVQRLVAQIMPDQEPHQALALLLRNRRGVIVVVHIDQGLSE